MLLISIDPKRARSELLKALISKSHGFRFIGAGGIGALRTITGDFGASIDMGANLWDMSAIIICEVRPRQTFKATLSI